MAIFPLAPGGKLPAIRSAHPEGDPLRGKCKGECGKQGHGSHDATCDLATIKRWWSEDPQRNIGWALRIGGRLFVALDEDESGALAGWCAAHDVTLPATEEQRTPSGGRHLIYRLPEGVTPTGQPDLCRGVNVRVAGKGYILVQPSTVGGKPYQLDGPISLAEVAEAPEAIIAHVTGRAAPAKPQHTGPELPASIPEGNRHSTIQSQVARWRSLRHVPRELALLGARELRDRSPGDRPITDSELERMVGWAWGRDGAEPEGETPAVQVYDVLDFLALQIPPRQWLIEKLLRQKDQVLIYAKTGVGKTYLSLALAWMLATGGRWHRWSAPTARSVLLIDGEMPGGELQARLEMLRRGYHGPVPLLKVLCRDILDEPLYPIDSPEGEAQIRPWLEGRDVVILDNISTLTTAAENETDAWRTCQEWTLAQRRAGRSAVWIHHAGKSGEQRGASRRLDILDLALKLSRPADYRQDQGARFVVEFEKSRGIFGPDAEPFEAWLRPGADGTEEWTIAAAGNARLALVRAAQAKGLRTVREIAGETGIPKSTVDKLLKIA